MVSNMIPAIYQTDSSSFGNRYLTFMITLLRVSISWYPIEISHIPMQCDKTLFLQIAVSYYPIFTQDTRLARPILLNSCMKEINQLSLLSKNLANNSFSYSFSTSSYEKLKEDASQLLRTRSRFYRKGESLLSDRMSSFMLSIRNKGSFLSMVEGLVSMGGFYNQDLARMWGFFVGCIAQVLVILGSILMIQFIARSIQQQRVSIK